MGALWHRSLESLAKVCLSEIEAGISAWYLTDNGCGRDPAAPKPRNDRFEWQTRKSTWHERRNGRHLHGRRSSPAALPTCSDQALTLRRRRLRDPLVAGDDPVKLAGCGLWHC